MQEVSWHRKQKWAGGICRVRTRQAAGNWMVLESLVSKEVNVTLEPGVAAHSPL